MLTTSFTSKIGGSIRLLRIRSAHLGIVGKTLISFVRYFCVVNGYAGKKKILTSAIETQNEN